jgi:hypothetical protein
MLAFCRKSNSHQIFMYFMKVIQNRDSAMHMIKDTWAGGISAHGSCCLGIQGTLEYSCVFSCMQLVPEAAVSIFDCRQQVRAKRWDPRHFPQAPRIQSNCSYFHMFGAPSFSTMLRLCASSYDAKAHEDREKLHKHDHAVPMNDPPSMNVLECSEGCCCSILVFCERKDDMLA